MMQTKPPEQGSEAKLEGIEIGLVIIGDEILSGKRADKHMPKLIELLAARGLQLAWAEYVGDSPERDLHRAGARNEFQWSAAPRG